MKLLLAALFALTSTSVFALSIKQPKSYTDFSNLPVELYSVSSLCPENARCELVGTNVEVTFNLPCSYNLLDFSYNTVSENGTTYIFVNALAGTSISAGHVSACLAFQTVRQKITLINNFDNIVIKNLTKKLN